MKTRGHQSRFVRGMSLATSCLLLGCTDGRVVGKPVVDETSNGLQARVLLADGRVASSATVTLTPGWYFAGASDSINRILTTDSQGQIEVDDLGTGAWWLEASLEKGRIRALVHWTAHSHRSLDLVLADPGTLVGQTRPLATIRVYGTTRWTKADSQGRFVLEGIAAGPVRLRSEVSTSTLDSLVGEAATQVVSGSTVTATMSDSIPAERALWRHGRLAILPADPLSTSDSLADFLVPVALGPSEFASGLTRASDLLFSDLQGGVLETHTESWDAAGRTALVWVRLPRVHPRKGDTLRVLWGKKGFARSSSTIRSDSTYGIWHLGGPSATANAIFEGPAIAMDSSTTPATGNLGEGRRFGSTEWLRIPAPPSSSVARAFTVSCWVKMEGKQLHHAKILDLGPSWEPFGTILLDIDTATGKAGMQIALSDSSWQRIESRAPLSGWNHLAAAWNGETREAVFYLDGEEQGRLRTSRDLLLWPDHDLLLGNQPDGRDGMRGVLDECRWDEIDRSPDWVRHLHFLQTPSRIRLEDDASLLP